VGVGGLEPGGGGKKPRRLKTWKRGGRATGHQMMVKKNPEARDQDFPRGGTFSKKISFVGRLESLVG